MIAVPEMLQKTFQRSDPCGQVPEMRQKRRDIDLPVLTGHLTVLPDSQVQHDIQFVIYAEIQDLIKK